MTLFRVVGGGRAGLSFVSALQRCGWVCADIYGPSDDLVDAATGVQVLILSVPDANIAEVAASIAPGDAVVLHVSGATTLDALLPHQRRGSVHPLVSLPDPTIGADRLLDGVSFAIAGDPAAAEVVAVLGGRAIDIDDEQRTLYHATAAIAANHLVALCGQVERLAVAVGLPEDTLWNLMATTLDNIRDIGAAAALTGPASRGDTSTIDAHLSALPDSEHELYRSLAREAARLAGRDPYP